MAIVITREPAPVSPSKNPIVYHLQSDARIDNPGVAAVNRVFFKGNIADGTVVALRWNGVEQRMVARTTIQSPGFEFPAGVAGNDYMTQVLVSFRDNYYIDQDFTVTANEGTFNYLEFTARQPGKAYEFIIQNTPQVEIKIQKAGIDRKIKPNFCIYTELWVEKADWSGYERIFSESLQVNESGRTEWDLSNLLHPELSNDLHDWQGRQFNRDKANARQYYIRYAEAWGERFQVGKITKAPVKKVVLAGTPYESGSSLTIIDIVRESNEASRDRALRIGPDVRYVYPDEPQFLTFLNTRDEIYLGVHVRVAVRYAAGGQSQILTIPLNEPLQHGQRATCNVGYQQLDLSGVIGSNAVESYTVQFFSGLITAKPISRPYTFVLKYEYKPYRRYFVYQNSLGALDTMHTWGKGSQEIELSRQTAEKYLPVDYQLHEGTFIDWDIRFRQRFGAATGYRHAAEIRRLRDFYISRNKYRFFQGKALPISVLSNSLAEYKDGDSLLAQSFEYIYNFEDDTFAEQDESPDEYAPPPGFQGAAGAPIVISVPPRPGQGQNGNFLFDREPLAGSYNLIRSGDLYKIFQNLQSILPKGLLGQYIRGDHTIGNFLTDALQVIENRLPGWKQQEFPEWIQEESSSGRIGADEHIGDAPGGASGQRQSGLYHTPNSSVATGWPVDGKRASLIRVMNGEPGSQTGSDIVVSSDGKMYIRALHPTNTTPWREMGLESMHPDFDRIPPIVVEKGIPFTNYIDLADYLKSYHQTHTLTVAITYNGLKFKGVEIESDGELVVKISGLVKEDIPIHENMLLVVTDLFKNQAVVSLTVSTLGDPTDPTDPTDPGDLPACQYGPFHFPATAINVLDNGHIILPFDAEDVTLVEWVINSSQSAEKPLRTGKSAPVNNTPFIDMQFSIMTAGTYWIGIRGALCKSNWSWRQVTFTEDNRPVCPKGPFHFPDVPIEILDNGHIIVPFDAGGVDPVEWAINVSKNPTNPLRTGQSPPIAGTPFFDAQFEKLPGGTYWLGIRGVLCKSNWAWIEVTFPIDSSLNWSPGYPKHVVGSGSSKFVAQVDLSGRYLTELFNMTIGGNKLYSAEHDYIADTTEIEITKAGGWADADYKLIVGSLSQTIRVGNPPQAASISFKLVKGWNGDAVADLRTGSYAGPLLEDGFNVVLTSSNLGFEYRSINIKIEYKHNGSFVDVRGYTFTAPALTNSISGAVRLFKDAGVDSRLVPFSDGKPLNRYGEFRVTYEFVAGGATVQTFQQTFRFSLLEVKGGIANLGTDVGRYVPVLGRVQLDGENVVNNNVWAPPLTNTDNLEYSPDAGSTWFPVSAWFNHTGTTDYSNVMLLNSQNIDHFPKGSTRSVVLRVKSSPSIRTRTISISNQVTGGPIVSVPNKDGMRRKQIGSAVFSWVNGRDFTMEITDEGHVRLNYAETKASSSGANQVAAILVDSTGNPVPPAIISALRSPQGLQMPDGGYTIYLFHVNPAIATNVDQIWQNLWTLLANPESYMHNSGDLQYVIFEIKGYLNSNSSSQINPNAAIQKAAWYPQAQLLEYSGSFPANKHFGITKRVAGVTPAQLLTKVTAIQARYGDVNNGLIPYDRAWLLTDKGFLQSQKGDAHRDWSGSIGAGQTITVDATGLNVTTSDILSDTYRGYRVGNEPVWGLDISPSIEGNGTIRFTVHNPSGQTVNLSGGYFYVYYFTDTDQQAERLYGHGARAGAVTTGEQAEGGLPGYAVEETYKKCYALQKTRDGITSVLQSKLIGDYFQNNYGMGTHVNTRAFRNNKAGLRALMASESAARNNSGYYQSAYEYRHRIINCYVDGMGRMLDGSFLWETIFNIENNYIAMPDRYVMGFCWFSFEGVNTKIDGQTWQRLPIESPAGDLIRLSRGEGSYEVALQTVFFLLVAAEGAILWHDTGEISLNVNEWDKAFIGGPEDWKTMFQPTGGNMVQYDQNNPSQPKYIQHTSGRWQDTCAPNHNGAFAAADIFIQIQDKITNSLRYANFSYVENGVSKSGYQSGNAPVTGALGNSEVSRFNKRNIGQHNVVNCWDYDKPLFWIGEGPAGKVAIVVNQNAGITGETVYTTTELGGHTFTHRGTGLGVYSLDSNLNI